MPLEIVLPLRGPVVKVGEHFEELVLVGALALTKPLLVVEGDLAVHLLEPPARLPALGLELVQRDARRVAHHRQQLRHTPDAAGLVVGADDLDDKVEEGRLLVRLVGRLELRQLEECAQLEAHRVALARARVERVAHVEHHLQERA